MAFVMQFGSGPDLTVIERIPLGNAATPDGQTYQVVACRHNDTYPGTDSAVTFAVEKVVNGQVTEATGFFDEQDAWRHLSTYGPYRFNNLGPRGVYQDERIGLGIPDAYISKASYDISGPIDVQGYDVDRSIPGVAEQSGFFGSGGNNWSPAVKGPDVAYFDSNPGVKEADYDSVYNPVPGSRTQTPGSNNPLPVEAVQEPVEPDPNPERRDPTNTRLAGVNGEPVTTDRESKSVDLRSTAGETEVGSTTAKPTTTTTTTAKPR